MRVSDVIIVHGFSLTLVAHGWKPDVRCRKSALFHGVYGIFAPSKVGIFVICAESELYSAFLCHADYFVARQFVTRIYFKGNAVIM